MFKRFGNVLYFASAMILLAFSVSKAIDLEISPVKIEKSVISAEISIADSLPENLTRYMKKGVPISFDYKLELWRSRAGWLDKLVDNVGIVYRLRYDTWEKGYTIVSEQSRLIIEYVLEEDREAFDLVKSSGNLGLTIDDTSGEYYIIGKLSVKTMSLSNLREVESWLKGEISGAKKPKIRDAPDKFGEFLFNTALKVSGLKNISEETRTRFFEIDNDTLKFNDK